MKNDKYFKRLPFPFLVPFSLSNLSLPGLIPLSPLPFKNKTEAMIYPRDEKGQRSSRTDGGVGIKRGFFQLDTGATVENRIYSLNSITKQQHADTITTRTAPDPKTAATAATGSRFSAAEEGKRWRLTPRCHLRPAPASSPSAGAVRPYLLYSRTAFRR